MSFGVGLNVMKLNTRGRSTKGSMPLEKATKEAFSERASKTESLDRSRSHLNVYKLPPGVTNGEELATWFRGEFDAWREQRKQETGRAPSALTNPAATFAIYPNGDESQNWDEKRTREFFGDALASLSDWLGHEPDAWAIHFDEGAPHVHVFDRMRDENGDYATSRMLTPKSMKAMHRDYVEQMRARGWDVTVHKGREEREAAGERVRTAGLSANDHARLKEAERALEAERAEAYEQMAEDAQRALDEAALEVMDDAEGILLDAMAEAAPQLRRARDAEREADEAEARRDEAQSQAARMVAEATAQAQAQAAQAVRITLGVSEEDALWAQQTLPDSPYARAVGIHYALCVQDEAAKQAEAEAAQIRARAEAEAAERVRVADGYVENAEAMLEGAVEVKNDAGDRLAMFLDYVDKKHPKASEFVHGLVDWFTTWLDSRQRTNRDAAEKRRQQTLRAQQLVDRMGIEHDSSRDWQLD